MFQAVFSLILIANLLACPLLCASCDAGELSVDECAPKACSCCHHESDSSGDSDPERSDDAPSDDCSCPNCLCEGATLQDGFQLPDVYPQPASFWHESTVVPSDVGASIRNVAFSENADGRRNFCGRDAQVAFQSWLI